MIAFINKLEKNGVLTKEEFSKVFANFTAEDAAYAAQRARMIADSIYGKDIYIRGLIEFTSYCKNDCNYCGLQKSNHRTDRYRLTEKEILDCCKVGYDLGFRTFVLQGGEDPYFTDDRMIALIKKIKSQHPDCALTLSIGEKSRESYQAYWDAGADRYLLRHETANDIHYGKLHPMEMSLENRKRCLFDLKDIGYQVGCGFMVGSPGQTPETLADDFLFIKELHPEMIGIGPFIPHPDTIYAKEPRGTLEETLFLISMLRLMEKDVLLPATTALATIHPKGRELGMEAGANVVMPNLSPQEVRKKYDLYEGKVCTGEEAAECRNCLEQRVNSLGYRTVVSRGDVKRI